jgi:hypothetical protein
MKEDEESKILAFSFIDSSFASRALLQFIFYNAMIKDLSEKPQNESFIYPRFQLLNEGED